MLLHGIAALTLSLSVMPERVLVVGGAGRVGGSTARWLSKLAPNLQVAVGGRNKGSFESARSRLPAACEFVRVDLDGGDSGLAESVAGYSLIVHTAGPFQQRTDPALMRAAIKAGIPYCDVCDELVLARNAKALSEEAKAAGVPAVVSCGIWPGVSALMAAEAVDKLGGPGSCEKLEFSFFTAGTGGAGPTIVSATFLLLATEVAMYVDGQLVEKEPWLDRRVADFGEGVGSHECFTVRVHGSNPRPLPAAACLVLTNHRGFDSRTVSSTIPMCQRPPRPWAYARASRASARTRPFGTASLVQ